MKVRQRKNKLWSEPIKDLTVWKQRHASITGFAGHRFQIKASVMYFAMLIDRTRKAINATGAKMRRNSVFGKHALPGSLYNRPMDFGIQDMASSIGQQIKSVKVRNSFFSGRVVNADGVWPKLTPEAHARLTKLFHDNPDLSLDEKNLALTKAILETEDFWFSQPPPVA